MITRRQISLAIIAIHIAAVCLSAEIGMLREKRAPLQRDSPSDSESTGNEGVELDLQPSGQVMKPEGGSVTLECTITNKPAAGQIQWYYIVRGESGQSFDNFTIIANEVATVDNNKYHVWTDPGDIYSITISDLRPKDSGEYCCFLFVSYSETYRKLTQVIVSPADGNGGDRRQTRLDKIIEEAVEHDIEKELGSKLNITQIKSNDEAKTLIHNATEQIKSLLNIDEGNDMEFRNGSTKLIVSRKMKGMSSQVKTVVTSLLSKISTVDTNVARILLPSNVKQNGGVGPAVSYVGRQTGHSLPDWRTLYNEYKKQQGTNVNEVTEQDNNIPHTPPPYTDDYDKERAEEESNVVEQPAVTDSATGDISSSKPRTKCEYQIVINEFDPSQCPAIHNGQRAPAAAAMYYEADSIRHVSPEESQEVDKLVSKASNEQLTRLENRLMDEMVNTKMVNQTVKMHDDMLQKTEKMLEAQTTNLTNMEDRISVLQDELKKSQEDKENMEQKLTEVMLNILEVNKRLDVAMKAPNNKPYPKSIAVESASETIQCDRHPNVTHYKDCSDAYQEGNRDSGVYYIRPLYSACPIPVWCDMDTYPGGWTVIQRRENGQVSFNRGWADYRRGFGEVTSEHWLGNDNLFLISNQASYMIRIDLWDFYNSRVFAEYRGFKVDGERDGYRLTAANYSGTAGDGLKSHNNLRFSTRDRDHDMWEDYHCANEWEGGWWFTNCWSSYLNGAYYNVSNPPYNGISWREWKEEQLLKSEMKIRPIYMEQSDEATTTAEQRGDDTPNTTAVPTDGTQGDEPLRSMKRQKSINRKLNLASTSRK